MFDVTPDPFDHKRLEATLAHMSDEELNALEDDLDFCNFTGVPTVRVLEVLNDLTELDEGWQRMLATRSSPAIPQPF